jgi:hypothetical protein
LSGAEGKGGISPSQIKAIHTVIHKFGLDDEAYRHMLYSRYKVTSCKELSWRQAEELLELLNGGSTPLTRRRSEPPGRRSVSGVELKYTDMDGRQGFASGAQLRLIDALFHQVTRAEGEEMIEKALNSFVHRIVGVVGLRMIKGWQVEKIIKALQAMGAVPRLRSGTDKPTGDSSCTDTQKEASP